MNRDLTIKNINSAKELGLAIKRIRKIKKMTQTEVAEKFNIRQATVSDIENGRGTLSSLFSIIHALKINVVFSTGSAGTLSTWSTSLDLIDQNKKIKIK